MKYIIGIIFIINSETHVEWRNIKTNCQDWWDANVMMLKEKNINTCKICIYIL
jgi:subtilase family serine protease